jgi:hypothetical protein
MNLFFKTKTATPDNKKHMVDYIHLDKKYSSLFLLKNVMKDFIYSSPYSD